MTQVCIIPLPNLPKATRDTAWAGAREAARIWMDCLALFQQAMATRSKWPTLYSLQTATEGKYALHSQTIQMVSKCILTAFSNTRELRKTHPKMRMKYPQALKHLAKVNRITLEDTAFIAEAAFELWSQRSTHTWSQDLSWLH